MYPKVDILTESTKMNNTALVSYSSSDFSSDEDVVESTAQKVVQSSPKKEKLPLPGDIVNLFSDRVNQHVDDPAEHDGRVRSFAHVEGNWATLVYAAYEPPEEFFELQSELFKCLRPLEFQPLEDYHISLSRTVVVRHHWIKDLKESLQEQFTAMTRCACEIDGVTVLSNDEHTRSFLVLNVTSMNDMLQSYVGKVDECFKQYNLQKYYQPPLFHISIGWCVDDVIDQVTVKMKQNLKETLHAALQEDSDLRYFTVENLVMKTGNKLFDFPLLKHGATSGT